MARTRVAQVERLLTVAEVAELFSTSERFPRRLIAERRIRFVVSVAMSVSLNPRCVSSSQPGWSSLCQFAGAAAGWWPDAREASAVRLCAQVAIRPLSGLVHRAVRDQADGAWHLPHEDGC